MVDIQANSSDYFLFNIFKNKINKMIIFYYIDSN